MQKRHPKLQWLEKTWKQSRIQWDICRTQFQGFEVLLSDCFMIQEGKVFVYMVTQECTMSKFQPVGKGKEWGGTYSQCLRLRRSNGTQYPRSCGENLVVRPYLIAREFGKYWELSNQCSIITGKRRMGSCGQLALSTTSWLYSIYFRLDSASQKFH